MLLFYALFVVYFLASIYFIDIHTCNNDNCDGLIMLLSWLGVFQLIVTLQSIKKAFGSYICLYSIFYMFLFIFSYGQFIMWAFGIHYEAEMTVSKHVRFIDENTVVRIQVVSLQLLSIFSLFAMLALGKDNTKRSVAKDAVFKEVSKLVAIPMLVVSGAINMYVAFSSFEVAADNGYGATFDLSLPAILKYFGYMFIPAIFLNLVVHDFSKKSFYILTCVFLVYAVPLAITGDRGSWIYFLGPWLWCYFFMIDRERWAINSIWDKRKRRTKIFQMLIIVMCVLYVSSVFVSVRSIGYSVLTRDAFKFSWKGLYLPFVKPFFEMGQSARILGIIIPN